MIKKIYFKVYGRVQGIGFRWFVKEIAEKYNISGWVRNVEDGSVEGKINGEEEKINLFLNELKNNHPLAIVNKIEINNIEEEFSEKNFYIKH